MCVKIGNSVKEKAAVGERHHLAYQRPLRAALKMNQSLYYSEKSWMVIERLHFIAAYRALML